MNGIIRRITTGNRSSLIDSTGVERFFRRGQLMDEEIEEHDVVSFDLDGTTVVNIEMEKRHQRDIVFSWT
ncbi:MAG: hypothetical protein A2Y71_06280 [Bacteroidetes bacterium RBG_13_42_15]|nr:MAG: hypothetical protein A2Y71_06280 [Bacteroidetes bacterium RBG_13_42_15]